ncbi:hypothetical protein ACJJTC_004331 [Scirpophaga incertulas]
MFEFMSYLSRTLLPSDIRSVFLYTNKFQTTITDFLLPTELDLHKVLVNGGGKELLSPQERLRYQSLIGGLNYLATSTRPDIAAANHVATHYSNECCNPETQAQRYVMRPRQRMRGGPLPSPLSCFSPLPVILCLPIATFATIDEPVGRPTKPAPRVHARIV